MAEQRLIDANALKENIQRYMSSDWVMPCDEILKRIDNAPTIEPEKVKESELIKAYTKGFDTGVETERQQSEEYLCKTCKSGPYYLDNEIEKLYFISLMSYKYRAGSTPVMMLIKCKELYEMIDCDDNKNNCETLSNNFINMIVNDYNIRNKKVKVRTNEKNKN